VGSDTAPARALNVIADKFVLNLYADIPAKDYEFIVMRRGPRNPEPRDAMSIAMPAAVLP
jgi:hypothetical protein